MKDIVFGYEFDPEDWETEIDRGEGWTCYSMKRRDLAKKSSPDEVVEVQVAKVNDKVPTPSKAHDDDAAYDLKSVGNVHIPPGKIRLIRTGLKLAIPKGYKGEIYSRSGNAMKGVIVANSPGKIDSGYRGEVKVLLANLSDSDIVIMPGDRVAQLEINPCLNVKFNEVESLDDTARGEGGLGSTGR